jgi:hypothetical protein
MVWHIFRKDWRLLWPAAISIALANAMQRAMLSRADQLGERTLLQLAGTLGVIVLVATAILIVLAVHQDPLPGLQQDWLVRPIRRSDLLLSKVLFVVLLVQVPILLAEIGQGLMAGLPLGASTGTALSRSVWMLLAMDLPCLALAALTRNLVQAIGAALATAVAFVVLFGFYVYFVFDGGGPIISVAAIAWLAASAQTVSGLMAVAVVLALQYRRRKTLPARWAFAAAALVWISMDMAPWGTAFTIQEHFSPQPQAGAAVQIAFDPSVGRYTGRRGGNPENIRIWKNVQERAASLYIPVRIDGLKDGRWLLPDATTVRITDSAGKPLDLHAQAMPLEIRESSNYQSMMVEDASYSRVKDQPLRLEIEYSLTVMRANPVQTVPAVDGDRWIPDLGRCRAGASPSGSSVELHCVAARPLPCMDWSLENTRTGQKSPRARPPQTTGMYHPGTCLPDYSPYIAGIGGDPGVRYDTCFSLAGLMEPSHLNDARLVALVYRPEAHFIRRVVIPDFRLSDWRVP